MDRLTLRMSIASLLQRSRQALAMYTDLSKRNEERQSRDIQIEQWQLVNQEFVEALALIAPYSQNKLVTAAYLLRDRFNQTWRDKESRLALMRRDLMCLIEQADFMKVNVLSFEAAQLKANMQAYQAAFNELNAALKQSAAQRPVVLLQDQDVLPEAEVDPVATGNVVQFDGKRRKKFANL